MFSHPVLKPLIPTNNARKSFILDPQVVQQIHHDQDSQPFGSDKNTIPLECVRFRVVVTMGEVDLPHVATTHGEGQYR